MHALEDLQGGVDDLGLGTEALLGFQGGDLGYGTEWLPGFEGDHDLGLGIKVPSVLVLAATPCRNRHDFQGGGELTLGT